MTQNSKQKAHRSCSCQQCKRGSKTDIGHFIQNQNERKLRRQGRVELGKLKKGEVPADLQELEDADVLGKINSPYTD